MDFDEWEQEIQDLIILNNNMRDSNQSNSTELQIIEESVDVAI